MKKARHAQRASLHRRLSPALVLVGLLLLVGSVPQLAPGLDTWRQASATSNALTSPMEGLGPARTAGDEYVVEDPVIAAAPLGEDQNASPVVEETVSPGPIAWSDATGQVGISEDTVPAPVSVSIPSIGVETKLIKLGLNADRSLQVPRSYSTAGWYTKGGAPGDVAPAVIVGHYDSSDGPAVFYRLPHLLPKQSVQVGRADGSVAMFVVDRVERFSKNKFPTDEVYGSVVRPELRLITCGGSFDYSTRHYRDNYVVFAHLA